MLNAFNPPQASQHIQDSHHSKKNRFRIIIAVTSAMFFITIAGAAWQYQRTQPITAEQRAALTALAVKAADKTGKTRRKMWEEMKAGLEVRKVGDVRQKDFDKARGLLLQESK